MRIGAPLPTQHATPHPFHEPLASTVGERWPFSRPSAVHARVLRAGSGGRSGSGGRAAVWGRLRQLAWVPVHTTPPAAGLPWAELGAPPAGGAPARCPLAPPAATRPPGDLWLASAGARPSLRTTACATFHPEVSPRAPRSGSYTTPLELCAGARRPWTFQLIRF